MENQDYPKHPMVMESAGLEKVCPYRPDTGMDVSKCPHPVDSRDHKKKIKDDITECVGNTPLVRINNITKAEGIKCELLAKCEFMNPGGSVKDRVGRRMIVDALKTGRIKQGDILIEPTSGNTGVGLCVAAAAKGFKVIITMPEKMSQEKQDVLKALGAEIIRTPNEYGFDHLKSHIGIAYTLSQELPDSHILDQYKNPGNPMSHYDGTAEEIWEACEGKLDYMFLGAGTGGTVCGISRKLKEKNPNIKIIGVDPYGSILAEPAQLNEKMPPGGGYEVEGIGYDFVPRVLDRSLVDEWVKIGDEEALPYARRLVKEEGFLCGASSGTAMAAAMQYIKKHDIGEGKRCVVLFPDNIRNYITKFINDDWMNKLGLLSEEECLAAQTPKLVPNTVWGQEHAISSLKLKEAQFMSTAISCSEAISLIKETNCDQFPVKDDNGEIVGIITTTLLQSKLSKQKVALSDPVAKCMGPLKNVRRMTSKMPIHELSRVLERESFVLVDEQYIATSFDVLDFQQQNMAAKS